MNIGEVLELLREDFPSISIPKIRFLEEKGIVTPERTPSGYRKFSHADVERLRYALRLQRDHHQPLARIVEILDAIDRGLEPPPLVDLTPTVPDVALSRRRAAQPRVVPPPRRPAALAPRAAQDRRDLRGAARPARAVRPGRPRRGHRPLRHRRAGRSARRPASSPSSASSRGTCARSRPPPTARSAWSSRWSPRSAGPPTRPPSARTEDTVSQLAALSVRLHATLVKTGLAATCEPPRLRCRTPE